VESALPSRTRWKLPSSTQTLILVCFVAALSYLAPALESALIAHPPTVWPLWPSWALLVPILLWVPRRIWVHLISAALAGCALYDLQTGVSLRSVAWFIPANTIQVLIAALSLGYFFGGMRRLNSVATVARYLAFAVVLAPSAAAFVSALGIQGNYWGAWRIAFFSDALAFIIFTPAILSWVSDGRSWLRKSLGYHCEMAALLVGLAVFSYLCFAAPTTNRSPALLYSLVPFLLWSTLRFGCIGASSSVILVGFLSVWGASHGRGPFIDGGQLNNVFSIQLFLIFTAIPFMVLAAVVEERKTTNAALSQSDERFRLAVHAGRMFAYEWDVANDVIVRSAEGAQILGLNEGPRTTGREDLARVHPEDRLGVMAAVSLVTPEKPNLRISYRVVRPDGSAIWVERVSRAYFDGHGKMLRMVGMVADITQRKRAEEAVFQREQELLEAQRVAQVGSWQWDQKSDVVFWSKELYRISGRDPNLPPPSFREQAHLYTAESWDRLRGAVAEALRTGASYELDLHMIRPDGSTRWITDRGEALRDNTGQIARLRGTAQDITERKQAEDALRASEEKFRSVFRDAAVGMVIVSLEGRFLAANQAFCECLGYTEEELLQRTVESVTLPEDWPSFSRKLSEAVESGIGFQRTEKHCVHKSGRVVITESSASLIRGADGESYFVGEVLDITERKLAAETLSNTGRKLVEAHEEERTWIARELHDDFNQRIALLAVNLERLKQRIPGSDKESQREIQDACDYVSELGSDIQALSHRLHSSKLEYLGIAAACKGFCRELSNHEKVEIDFHADSIPKALSKEASLCLFRVMQEALQNAVKHSGTRRFKVSLEGLLDEVHLSVQDHGVGFEVQKEINGYGLGIVSMRERLKLVDGQLSIDSKPQHGTTVHVRVPVGIKMKSAGIGG
jgi:PAS domain S-box-containing protein